MNASLVLRHSNMLQAKDRSQPDSSYASCRPLQTLSPFLRGLGDSESLPAKYGPDFGNSEVYRMPHA